MTVLRAEAVTKVFGEGAAAVRAVNGATLSVEAGEIVLLLGPSGSGKTTLLSILGGLLRPTAGSVSLGGVTVDAARTDSSWRLHQVGFVFQSFNLLTSLSAVDNVALPLLLLGVRRRDAETRAHELLVSLGLAERSRAQIRTLSGGEKQRVSLARALVANPSVVLADEPTASLDTRTGQRAMRVLAESVHHRGQATVVVTHDTRLIPFADRVLRIEDGRIRADGSTD